MKKRELSLLLYIACVKSVEEQSFEFIHKVFGKKSAERLIKGGFIAEHKDGFYVLRSYGGRLAEGFGILSENISNFERRDKRD